MSTEGDWCHVSDSDSLAVGTVRSVSLCGMELVVWRGIDAKAVVMDARCPHLWSHLGAEGVVDGCELVCSAHFWRFDPSGKGTKVNIGGRRDPKSDVQVHPSREGDGRIEVFLVAARADADPPA